MKPRAPDLVKNTRIYNLHVYIVAGDELPSRFGPLAVAVQASRGVHTITPFDDDVLMIHMCSMVRQSRWLQRQNLLRMANLVGKQY